MCGHQVRSYVPHVTTDQGVEHYEIRVAGRLGPRWAAWFDGLAIVPGDDGTTAISGAVVDQAALHGLLQKLRDIGLPLVSVTPIPHDTSAERSARPTPEGN
jgi:hypothetical protein